MWILIAANNEQATKLIQTTNFLVKSSMVSWWISYHMITIWHNGLKCIEISLKQPLIYARIRSKDILHIWLQYSKFPYLIHKHSFHYHEDTPIPFIIIQNQKKLQNTRENPQGLNHLHNPLSLLKCLWKHDQTLQCPIWSNFHNKFNPLAHWMSRNEKNW